MCGNKLLVQELMLDHQLSCCMEVSPCVKQYSINLKYLSFFDFYINFKYLSY
jgi:hypothetical protein